MSFSSVWGFIKSLFGNNAIKQEIGENSDGQAVAIAATGFRSSVNIGSYNNHIIEEPKTEPLFELGHKEILRMTRDSKSYKLIVSKVLSGEIFITTNLNVQIPGEYYPQLRDLAEWGYFDMTWSSNSGTEKYDITYKGKTAKI